MSSDGTALDRHRTQVRVRLLSAAMVRPEADSVTWKVNREIIVVAGWGRAILLQFAHPLIAAGVADHSSFRGGLIASFRRLFATVRAMLSLTFGTDEEATRAAAGINLIHDRVFGHLGQPVGAFGEGQRYSAHDPELLRWVHATLLESIPLTYELVVGRLTVEERDRYCGEAAILEPLLDIPEGLLPRNSAQLAGYVREMLQSDRIAVSPKSRALAHAVLFPPGWRLMWPVFRPLQLMTIGLLPPDIRDGFGFSWSARDARALTRWTAALRVLQHAAPRLLREWPAARRGENSMRSPGARATRLRRL